MACIAVAPSVQNVNQEIAERGRVSKDTLISNWPQTSPKDKTHASQRGGNSKRAPSPGQTGGGGSVVSSSAAASAVVAKKAKKVGPEVGYFAAWSLIVDKFMVSDDFGSSDGASTIAGSVVDEAAGAALGLIVWAPDETATDMFKRWTEEILTLMKAMLVYFLQS